MADRYWVGGSGSWTTSSTTNWSATSGGAGGASVPTAADSVFFDQAGTYTVTLTGALTCLDFNVSAGAITFTSTGTLAISGSMSITNVTPTWSATGAITFNSTTTGRTVTTNGMSFSGGIFFNGVGGGWTLDSSLTTTGGFNATNGTVDTSVSNYGITASGINATSGTLNLNGSTIATTGQVCIDIAAGATLNAGTSQFNCTVGTGLTYQLRGGGKTYYNVAFNTASATTVIVTGANTFNNFSVTGPSTVGAIKPVTFAANQTINGTLSTNGTAGNRRLIFTSATTGLQFDLAINSTPSLTDVDFRDLRVTGTAAPISGTRIGDLRGCSGITFDAPKTVYWNLPAGGNWTATAWASSSGGGGAISDDNFPLPQDTAVIVNTGLNTSATVTINISSLAIGTIDISGRTTAMTLSFGASLAHTLYGDLKLSTSVATSGITSSISFVGRNIQTITSAGRTIQPNIDINSPGGTVELVDALNISTSGITVTNGTFDTKNFNVTAGALSSSNSNVRTINLGSSTVTLSTTLSAVAFSGTNLTFNAGTSLILLTAGSTGTQLTGGGFTFYDVSFTSTAGAITATIAGNNTYRNLSFTAPSGGILQYIFSGNQTITGTLTCAGATAIRRIFLRSDTLGTARTLTVNSLSATDCDFRDITIAGAAAGSSPTRAGDCGGNSGITFPAAKTVYWNLAGTQNWNATGWAPGSGGTPDINNFPLAQDTAVFDNTGAAGTVSINAAWNIGTFDASLRTSAMTFGGGTTSASIHGDWSFGTGITHNASSGSIIFVGRGIRTITSNGVTFTSPVTIDSAIGTVQLADALTLDSSRTLFLTSGTFNAVTYNVTTGAFSSSNSNTRTLRMGTGTWTLGFVGTIWGISTATNLVFYKDSADIVLSSISTSTRAFDGGSLSYNKLTIGGTTGISTLNMSGNNQFTELASTKTVAHTIALATTTQTFGKWSVTGTVGNVVTVNGTGTTHVIAGARVTGVDYLAMGTIGFSATSPGEFYAGANSTGSNATIIKTAAPTPVTRYWVGGTGTWNASSTTNWSDTSGGSGGFSVPTSADAVIFDSASNATAYTVTLTATQLRCGSLTMAGPASGNLTWAGSAPLAIHDNVTLAATGITRTYNATIVLSGSTTGKTFTTNNLQPTNSGVQINGVGCGWSLGSAANFGTNAGLNVINGSFDTANYAFTVSSFTSSNSNLRSLTLGSSTITMSGSSTAINFGTDLNNTFDFAFNAGTSQINVSVINLQISGNGQTFHNVNLTGSGVSTITIRGANTFNNLTVTGSGTVGVRSVTFLGNQTINGTLTFSAGLNATRRSLVSSNTLGTTITLTCAAFSGTDVDFRDITIAGAAAPISGTRLGDCGGNSGITTTPKTVYWNLVAGGDWSATAWATGSGGTPDVNNFPLAQDTTIIENAGLNTSASISLNANWHIGTINMSTRTNAMTLAFAANPFIYGDWTFGTGVIPSGSGIPFFSKRGIQTITSNGTQFPNEVRIDSVNGTVQLADALGSINNFSLISGTFDAVSYNVTCRQFVSTGAATRTLSLGSGLWTTTFSGNQWNMSATGLTFNKGTANIIATAASGSSTFVGAGLTYNKLTIAGGTNTFSFAITGNNTFTEIASTRTVAYQITLTTTTQTVGAFTVSGSAGNRVTISGTSAANFANLIFTGATFANLDYIIPTFLKVYDINSDWYAGDNSINGGSYGWIFAVGVVLTASGNMLMMFM